MGVEEGTAAASLLNLAMGIVRPNVITLLLDGVNCELNAPNSCY